MAEEPAAAMKDAKFSPGNERWPLMAVLTWIATRSLKVTEQLASLDPAEAGQVLFDAQRNCGAPLYLSYANAFSLLTEKIESHAIAGLGSKIKWTAEPTHEHLPVEQCFARSKRSQVFESSIFDPHLLSNMNRGAGYALTLQDFTFHDTDCFTPKGSGFGIPNPDGSRDRWTWKAVTFGRDDVLRTWPGWPPALTWNAAKTRPWHAPTGISKGWIRNLPAGDYLPFAEVIDLLAFGRGKMAIGLAEIDEHAAQLRAGIALINAAIDGKIRLIGTPCERLVRHPHLLRRTGRRTVIGSDTLPELIPVPFGGRDWLGPRLYADEYAEIGHAPQSVSFCEVMVDRQSLLGWLTTVSTKAPQLHEADVTKLVLGEKMNPSVSIAKIVTLVQAKDPLFPREQIREIARKSGVKGKPGRPPRNSAE